MAEPRSLEDWDAPLRRATVLITGASGFLGGAMVDALLARGALVRALVRDALPEALRGRGVQVHRGAIDDRSTLDRAVEGATFVFHVAANLRMDKSAWDESYRTNVVGTRAIVDASLRAGVRRLIYTSSGSTLGKPLDALDGPIRWIDESSPYNFDGLGWVYPVTKHLGEREVLEGISKGLDAVITHPTAIFGPGDYKRNLLPLFRLPRQALGSFATRGVRSVCDVRDVADGHLRAAILGRSGERYALSGEAMTVAALMTLIAEAVDGSPPRWTLPASAVRAFAEVSERVAALRARPPLLSREMAMQSCLRVGVSSAKAERTLGYRSRPARASIEDTAAFYRAQGWLP
jgi:dihydroflavonol-4-reductase